MASGRADSGHGDWWSRCLLLGRPRVTRDIDALVLLDEWMPRVRRWVREFSAALEAPELLRDLNALVTRRRKREQPSARRRPKG